MTKKNKLLGMLAMVLVFGLMLIGCNLLGEEKTNNTSTSDIDGTWITTTVLSPGNNDNYLKFVAANGQFTEFAAESKTATTWKEFVKGTYPKDAKSPITFTVTHANPFMFIDDAEMNTWEYWNDYEAQFKTYVPKTMTITISDNKFTSNNITFERQ